MKKNKFKLSELKTTEYYWLLIIKQLCIVNSIEKIVDIDNSYYIYELMHEVDRDDYTEYTFNFVISEDSIYSRLVEVFGDINITKSKCKGSMYNVNIKDKNITYLLDLQYKLTKILTVLDNSVYSFKGYEKVKRLYSRVLKQNRNIFIHSDVVSTTYKGETSELNKPTHIYKLVFDKPTEGNKLTNIDNDKYITLKEPIEKLFITVIKKMSWVICSADSIYLENLLCKYRT